MDFKNKFKAGDWVKCKMYPPIKIQYISKTLFLGEDKDGREFAYSINHDWVKVGRKPSEEIIDTLVDRLQKRYGSVEKAPGDSTRLSVVEHIILEWLDDNIKI